MKSLIENEAESGTVRITGEVDVSIDDFLDGASVSDNYKIWKVILSGIECFADYSSSKNSFELYWCHERIISDTQGKHIPLSTLLSMIIDEVNLYWPVSNDAYAQKEECSEVIQSAIDFFSTAITAMEKKKSELDAYCPTPD